MKKQNFETE
jgi:hypothetical protein